MQLWELSASSTGRGRSTFPRQLTQEFNWPFQGSVLMDCANHQGPPRTTEVSISQAPTLFSEHTLGLTGILITDTLQNQRVWGRQCQVIDRKLKSKTNKQTTNRNQKQKKSSIFKTFYFQNLITCLIWSLGNVSPRSMIGKTRRFFY